MWQVFEAILDFLSPSRRYEREKLGQELQELVTTGIPQAYLRNPEAALRRWGKPAWNAWLGITEPKYRLTSGSPPDWSWRRLAVLHRDGKRCVQCGSDGLKELRNKRRRLSRRPRFHPEGGLHVHHRVPVSRGGWHGLDNLVTLCLHCHALEHPDNEMLATRRQRRRWSKVRQQREDCPNSLTLPH